MTSLSSKIELHTGTNPATLYPSKVTWLKTKVSSLMAPHISVHTASGTVPAIVCRASPLTVRTRTRLSSLEYRNMFSAIRSRNTAGIASSAPETPLCCPFMLRSWVKNVLTSSWATMALRCSKGRASKARWFMGRLRIWILGMLAFILSAWVWVLSGWGAAASAAARSASNPCISRFRAVFASSWVVFSSSKWSISSLTACSCSEVSASWIAVSSSASRVLNSLSLVSRALNSSRFRSILRRSIKILKATIILLSAGPAYLPATVPVFAALLAASAPGRLPDYPGPG